MIEVLRILALALFPAALILAALRDVTSYTIPNRISLALLAAFVPVALLAGMSPPAIGASAMVGVAMLGAGVGMFALRWIGGGDAKVIAVGALWLGWPAVMPFAVWTALAGGGLAVILMCGRRLGQPIVARGPPWVGRLLTPGGDVPYGLAICFGALMAYPASPIVQAGFLRH
jgi:prepilin peptidase CpaA